MTENMTIGQEAGTERRRCQMGREQGHQCWREATERLILEDRDPDVCAEHLRCFQTARAVDPLVIALEKMGEWVAGLDNELDEELLHYAFKMREEAYRDYWGAAVKHKAAELIAGQGEHEDPLTQEQAERVGELLLRAEKLLSAQVTLEEAPEAAFEYEWERWQMAASLDAAHRGLSEELSRYRREIKGR